jgi:hypothetical protein
MLRCTIFGLNRRRFATTGNRRSGADRTHCSILPSEAFEAVAPALPEALPCISLVQSISGLKARISGPVVGLTAFMTVAHEFSPLQDAKMF